MSMYHSLHRGLAAAFLSSALFVNSAGAQDILASTGVSTRSYSYAEVEYLTNASGDIPLLVNGLVDIAYGFALTGRYTNDQLEFDFAGEASAFQFTVGLLYHNQLFKLSNTDWFAEIGAGRFQLEVDTDFLKLTQGVNLFLLSGGVRQTLTERLELELATNFLLTEEVEGITNERRELTVSARGVFRLTRNFDAAISLTDVPDANFVGLGVRFTF